MKVYYRGRRGYSNAALPEGSSDVIELLWDNWDDFGFATTFGVQFRHSKEMVDVGGGLRLLIAHQHSSRKVLDELREKGWNGIFPPPGLDYISVPSDIRFYQQLKAHLGIEASLAVARSLRDASVLSRIDNDPAAISLIESKGFKDSLQRERGSVMAYLEGWKILQNQTIAVSDFEFRFEDVTGEPQSISFNFASETPLPHDINVLIGANGAGKSRLLHNMVNAWIRPDKVKGNLGFAQIPNLSQMVVVSYSPFELFTVDVESLELRDKDVYRYFGFRGRTGDPSAKGRSPPIRLSRAIPKRNAAHALIACLADDQKFRALDDWAKKVATVERVLRTAFSFDYAAVAVDRAKRVALMHEKPDTIKGPAYIDDDGDRWVPISTDSLQSANPERILAACQPDQGVAFFKDGKQLQLSSGQRLFSYVVINLLGVIRRNSLVLVDEPELFLHPSLEIQFVEMLKDILVSFSSKAILATHSEVVVREVPADCVHVFVRTDDGVVISHPPFQTFGGDIQRISSYVFRDNLVAKPFERWLRMQLNRYGSSKALLEALGDNLNEEMIIQVKAMEHKPKSQA